jgi:uncharacterized protein YidB (DUF937 family)
MGNKNGRKDRPQTGNTKHPLYATWRNIIQRCVDPGCSGYKKYGAKGITVSDEWLNSFEAFRDCMGLKPTPKHQIDRIDNSKGYEQGNCRWVTNKQNCNNKANNLLIAFNGETMTLKQWAIKTGINYGTLWSRIVDYKWPVDRALTAGYYG